MFMRLGIAEIGKHAIAHVFGDKATVALNQFSAAAVIGSDDAPQVLGVDLSRQRRRADQVTKHNRQLPTLSAILKDKRGGRSGLSHGCGGKLPDRPQNFQSVSESDAEL